MTSDTSEQLDVYRDVWTRVLREFGWSTERIEQWCKPLLEGHTELTLHEPAASWLSSALIPPDLSHFGPEKLGQLRIDLQEALDQGDDFWQPRSDVDLRKAHRRVDRLLSRYRRDLEGAQRGYAITDLPIVRWFYARHHLNRNK